MDENDEEQKYSFLGAERMRTFHPVLHIALFTATTFVNKYVLSVLKFTYPTIFQGWQTLVGAMLLRLLIAFGRLNLDLRSLSRTKVVSWLPVMLLYVINIYSGSVALSNMAIPHFLCFQNCVHIFPAIAESINQKQIYLSKRHIPHHVILVSCLMLYLTDTQHEVQTYLWMLVHILSVGSIILYENLRREAVQLSDLEKIYLNYIFSFLVLAPFSYFLGDAISAQNFRFWYYYRFYFGCILSGVFGALLSLTAARLKDTSGTIMNLDVAGVSRCTSALLSVMFFSLTVTPSSLLWVSSSNFAAMMLHSFRDPKRKPEGENPLLDI